MGGAPPTVLYARGENQDEHQPPPPAAPPALPLCPWLAAAPPGLAYTRAPAWSAARVFARSFGGFLLRAEPPPAEITAGQGPEKMRAPGSPSRGPLPQTDVSAKLVTRTYAQVTTRASGGRDNPWRPPRRAARTPAPFLLLATDGAELVGPEGRRAELGRVDHVAELAAAARVVAGDQPGELVVFVHELAHEPFSLPSDLRAGPPPFLGDAPGIRRRGFNGWTIIDGAPNVHVAFPGWSGDFAGAAGPAELLAAAERFRGALGLAYLFSGPATVHQLIRSTARYIGEPAPHPDLENPTYLASAFAVSGYAWWRDLTAAERARGWVRAFDRSGSFLASWRGCALSDGPWRELPGPFKVEPGPETHRPPGYWLVQGAAVGPGEGPGALPGPFARQGDESAGAWLTTPLLQLAVELAGGPVEVDAAWVASERIRPLERAAERLAAARAELDGLALGVLKDAYSGATAWFEYGPQPPHPLHRPHWRRTILDRHAANTYRALRKAEPGPFAWTEIDAALFAVDAPDQAPAGPRLGTELGAWKPKGRAVPMADALAALDAGGPREVLKLAGR